jgi:hypothetical protein
VLLCGAAEIKKKKNVKNIINTRKLLSNIIYNIPVMSGGILSSVKSIGAEDPPYDIQNKKEKKNVSQITCHQK